MTPKEMEAFNAKEYGKFAEMSEAFNAKNGKELKKVRQRLLRVFKQQSA